MAPSFFVIRNTLERLLYPRVCPFCGEIIPGSDRKLAAQIKTRNPYACEFCKKELDFCSGSRCIRCSKPVPEHEALCESCREEGTVFDKGISLLRHDDLSRKLVYDLKYSGLRDNADYAALEIAKRFGRIIESWDALAMIPVPLHRKRERERGFNQAEVLAEKIYEYMKLLGMKAPPVMKDCLIRTENTAALKGLMPDERRKSLRGAFEVRRISGEKMPQRVILVDDIFTTGATLNECAKTLRKSGCDMVYFLSVTIVSRG